jgi:hypothetical protein
MVTVDARGDNCPVETSAHELQPIACREREQMSAQRASRLVGVSQRHSEVV